MDIDLLNEPVKVTYDQKFCYFCRKQIFFELFATLAITWKLGIKSQLTELKQFYSQICLCKFHWYLNQFKSLPLNSAINFYYSFLKSGGEKIFLAFEYNKVYENCFCMCEMLIF